MAVLADIKVLGIPDFYEQTHGINSYNYLHYRLYDTEILREIRS